MMIFDPAGLVIEVLTMLIVANLYSELQKVRQKLYLLEVEQLANFEKTLKKVFSQNAN